MTWKTTVRLTHQHYYQDGISICSTLGRATIKDIGTFEGEWKPKCIVCGTMWMRFEEELGIDTVQLSIGMKQ